MMASETKLHIDLLESAWGIIANAGGGDWNNETAEWQQAARRFRAEYHVMLAEHRTPPPADAGREAVNWKAVRSAALTFAQDGDCTALDRALTRAGAPCPHFRPTEFGGDTCYFCGRDVRRHASPDNARAALAREGEELRSAAIRVECALSEALEISRRMTLEKLAELRSDLRAALAREGE